MIKIAVTDFSRVLLHPKDKKYQSGLNALNNSLLRRNPHYPFFNYFVLNDELLSFYKRVNSRIPVYVFTTETIQDHPSIKSLIENSITGVLSAQKLGIDKTDSQAYVKIANIINCRPDEVLYIDDKTANTLAASKAGMEVLVYKSNQEVITKLKELTYL